MTELELDKLDWGNEGRRHQARAIVNIGGDVELKVWALHGGVYDIYVWRNKRGYESLHLDCDPIMAQSLLYYYAELAKVTPEVTP